MKKLLIAVPMMAALTMGAHALDISPYAGVKAGFGTIGWSELQTDTLSGLALSAAFGGAIKTDEVNLRAELEYSIKITGSTTDNFNGTPMSVDSDMTMSSLVGNLYVDFLENYRLKPYVGISLGYAGVSQTITESVNGVTVYEGDGSESGLLYGISAGAGFGITDSLYGDLGVRYDRVSLDRITLESLTGSLGLRYLF